MRYCNRCKVIIENHLDDCPLCNQKTLKHDEVEEQDFPIQKVIGEHINKKIMKILVYLSITLVGTNIVINLTYPFKLIWAPYSIVVLFYAYLLIRTAIRSYKNIGTIVVINVYMLSVISFILDMLLGFARWSINYLIPFYVLAGILALFIFILLKPTRFINYFIYMLIIALFGLTLLVLLGINILTVKTPSVITAFISLMVIIGMFMFGDKRTKNEFIKRFHF